MACGRLGAEKDTAQGHVDDQLPFLGRNLPSVFHDKTDAGVVDQDVHPSEGRCDRLEESVYRIGRADVAWMAHHLGTH